MFPIRSTPSAFGFLAASSPREARTGARGVATHDPAVAATQLRSLVAGVRVPGPTLRQIHEAGIGRGPAFDCLAPFRQFRNLTLAQQEKLKKLWERANHIARSFRETSWKEREEFLNPRMPPFLFDRYVGGDLGCDEVLILLHHNFKRRLATEYLSARPSAPIPWREIVLFQRLYFRNGRGRQGSNVEKLRQLRDDFEVLAERNPASLGYLADPLGKIVAGSNGSINYYAWIIHEGAKVARALPRGAILEGPVVAAFDRGDSPTVNRTQHLPPYPGLHRATITAEGRLTVIIRSPLTEPDLSPHITPAGARVIGSFLNHLRDSQSRKPKEISGFAAALIRLVRDNPPSLPIFVARARPFLGRKKPSYSPGRLTGAVARSAAFLQRSKGKFEVEGPVLAFYFRNFRNRAAIQALYNRVYQNEIARVTFNEDGTYEVIRRKRARIDSGAQFSYRDATQTTVLPSPATRWGADEFAAPREVIAGRIRNLLDKVQRRLGLTTLQMERTWGIPQYWHAKTGRGVIPRVSLSDQALNRLGMSDPEKEELRHLETLLRLILDLKRVSSEGPYRAVGRLLRYFRLLAGIESHDLKSRLRSKRLFRGNWGNVETGWLGLPDADFLQSLAAELEVPVCLREDLVDHLLELSSSVRAVQAAFRPGGTSTVFPNPGMDLPYLALTTEELRAEVVRITRYVREVSALERLDFAREVGITFYDTRNTDRKANLAPRAERGYLAYMRRNGMKTEAEKLRLVRAALALHYNPVPEDAGLREAGRLYRYARSLIPGLEVKKLLKLAGIDVPRVSYVYFELGLARMPDEVRARLTAYLVKRHVLTADDVPLFTRKIDDIHRAMGLAAAP